MAAPDLRAELRKIPREPLLPVEKKLILWSLGIGLALQIVLLATRSYFPGGAG